MKFLDKVGFVVFSFIGLVLAMVMCFLIFGWVEVTNISAILPAILNHPVYTNISLGVSIILILLAVKCIYFMPSSSSKNEMGDGVLLENEEGKLLISKDTLENLVNSVARGFESTQNVKTEVVLDKENHLNVNVTLFVMPNAIIKELSTNLQARIKEVVKTMTGLEVTEVNIKVKNIVVKAEKSEN